MDDRLVRPPTHRSPAAGTLAAIGAYTLWGLVPLYWPLVDSATALEILAHRVVWTLLFVVLLLTVTRDWSSAAQAWADRRVRLLLLVAAVLVSINWGTFIWAVTNGFVLESSLGYFINPLISVLLGVLLLGEHLRPAQWLAVAVAALGVIVLTVGYGRIPVIALTLALSFGLYGLVKKRADVESVPSLAIETAYLTPIALAYLGTLAVLGSGQFVVGGAGATLVLIGAGLVTAVPLLLFGAAAIRIPLSTLGLLQYIGPALQFVLGVFVFGEELTALRWVGFVTVWLALGVFTADAVAHGRRQRHLRRHSPEHPPV